MRGRYCVNNVTNDWLLPLLWQGGNAMSTAHWRIGTDEVGLCPPHQVSTIPTPAKEARDEDASATDECPATDDWAATPRPLHRLRTARVQQGVSIRTAAHHLGMTMEEIRAQEHETSDLSLTSLHRWQQLLEVPIAILAPSGIAEQSRRPSSST